MKRAGFVTSVVVTYVLDAQSGARYRTEEVLGTVPGTDAQLQAARAAAQRAFAPAQNASAADGTTTLCSQSLTMEMSPGCLLPGVQRIMPLRCLGQKSLGQYQGTVAPC
jgi:hypothetical protein